MRIPILLTLISIAFHGFAQLAGYPDPTFKTGWYADGNIADVDVQADGKMVIVGDFTIFNDHKSYNIVRLNADYTVDESFDIGTGFTTMYNHFVNDVLVQPDGKILVAGGFSKFNGSTVDDLIRLNTDGSLDPTFNNIHDLSGPFASSPQVRTIALTTAGKIIVAGNFDEHNGVPTNAIFMLNPDGSTDTDFNIGDGIEKDYPYNATVYKIKMINDSCFVAAGEFKYVNNITRNDIARIRLNGSMDLTLNDGTVCCDGYDYITDFYVYPDSSMLLTGTVDFYEGFNMGGAAKVKSNGTYDTAYNTNLVAWTGTSNEEINLLTVLPGGMSIMCTGSAIYHVNTDGTKNLLYPSQKINYMAVEMMETTAGKYLIYGAFNNIGKTLRNHLALVDHTFNYYDPYPGSGFGTSVIDDMINYDDATILIAGVYSVYGGDSVNDIVKIWKSDGTRDISFNTGYGCNNSIYALCKQADGKILVGGEFTTYDSITANHLIRLNADGSPDNTFSSGTGLTIEAGAPTTAKVRSIALQPDGKILIAGFFNTYDGINAPRIVRLFSDGTVDPSFDAGTGPDDGLMRVLVLPDGKILTGGTFESFNGDDDQTFIVRLNSDGSIDPTFNTGGLGVTVCCALDNPSVKEIELAPDGKIFIGGSIEKYNGIDRFSVVRLTANGYLDASFNPGDNFRIIDEQYFRDLAVQPDGKLIATGIDDTFEYPDDYWLKRLTTSGTLDEDFAPAFRVTGEILVAPDSAIYVAGNFDSYLNYTRDHIVKLYNENAFCDAHYNLLMCEGHPFVLPSGETIYAGGTYYDTIAIAGGCDSVYRFDVDYYYTYHITTDTVVCENEIFTLSTGEIIDVAGTYIDTLTRMENGCDSIVTYYLSFVPITEMEIDTFFCAGDVFTLYTGEIITTPGIYYDTLLNISGCDSMVTYTVEFFPAFTIIDSVELPEGEIYILPDGSIADHPGTYTSNFETVAGCDSIITIVLTSVVIDSIFNQPSASFIIVPNPNNGNFMLEFSSQCSGNAAIFIYNAIGDLMYSENKSVAGGFNQLTLNHILLPDGLYFIEMKCNGSIRMDQLFIH